MHYLDYSEKKQHGTPDFPIEFYHVEETNPRYHMPFHWHMELEIIRILAGSLILSLNDEEMTVTAGDILFINEGVLHGGTPINCIYECIVFDFNSLMMHTDTCRRYLRPISKHTVMVRNHFTPAQKTFSAAANHLFETMGAAVPGSELTILGTLFELFGIIIREHYYEELSALDNPSGTKAASIKPVLEYIETSYSQPITLQDLSRIAGMSPKYFCRYFHAIIHKTPIEYLVYYRVERACFFLSTKDWSISETAFHCGFNDVSYFIRTFRRCKGLTPRQYIMEEHVPV